MPGSEPAAHPVPAAQGRRRLNLIIVALGTFFTLAMIGTALAPGLVAAHPLVLVALNPVPRHLLLVSNHVDPVHFFAVALPRMFGPDPFHYLLGRWYGDGALVWVERKSPTFGRTVRLVERLFERIGLLLLFLAPEGLVCVLAGAARVRPLTFVLVNLAGTLSGLIVVRLFGLKFREPIGNVLDFVEANVAFLTVASITVLLLSAWYRRRQRPARTLADERPVSEQREQHERDEQHGRQ